MMTPAQIAAVAANAGFSGDDLITAVAVALAESQPPGNEQSAGDKVNGQPTSFGLWQIHIPAHPEFEGFNHLDPQVNAHEAFDVYSTAGDSFGPWSTYSINGLYRNFLQDAATGVAQLVGASSPAVTPTPAAADSVGHPEFAATGVSFKEVLIVAGIGLALLWGVEQLS